MIQTVVKRDGRVVGFNEEKIIAAIRRAMLHTALGEDMELASTIADRIAYRGAEKMWHSYISLIETSGVLHVRQKREIFFWKLSKRNPTTLPEKTQI